MKLTTIIIRNFRSFDDHADVIQVGEMAAFVGKNSSGKSNILQALQLFFGQTSPVPEDFYYGDTERTMSVTVTFQVDSANLFPVLMPYVSPDQTLWLRREFKENDLKGKMYVGGKNQYTGTAEMNPFPDRALIASRVNAFLASDSGAPLLTYAHQKGQTVCYENYYDVLKSYWCDHLGAYPCIWNAEMQEIKGTALKEILSVLPPYYYLPVSYTTSKLTQDKHSYFQQIYQQILGDVNQLLATAQAEKLKKQVAALYRCAGMEKRCNDINELLHKTDGADSSVKMHIELGEPDYKALFHPAPSLRIDDGYDCDVQSKGQGIQRDAIFRLLKVFSQLNGKQQKQFILAIDEPEAFMHPTYKRSLYKSFLALCKDGCQVFYTTHDPAFVAVSRFDDIHTVTMVQAQQRYTSVFNCSFADMKRKEAFRNVCRSKAEASIRKELEHKCQGEQNEGFFADRIILVEGATESYALPVYFSQLGYDLDENNVVILRALSKTLLQLLLVIFSACRIPCYCIFDGDKPNEECYARFVASRSQNEKEQDNLKKLKASIKLNRSLLSLLQGTPEDFPDTTITDHYAVWERDFEHAVQRKLQGYEERKRQIARNEGGSLESKPLLAYHLATQSKLKDFPQDVQRLLADLLEKIKKAPCLPLADMPARTNVIRLDADQMEGAVPVYASAAGRNTTADGDTPVAYAVGNFPSGTSFLVHIQGDSMAHQIPDGCYVAVKQVKECPNPGRIAIFLLDGGEMVCKQYIERPTGERELKSLNSKYPSILLTEEMDCQVRGEVIMLGKKQPAIFFVE